MHSKILFILISTYTSLALPVHARVSGASVNVQPRSQGAAHDKGTSLSRGTREGTRILDDLLFAAWYAIPVSVHVLQARR